MITTQKNHDGNIGKVLKVQRLMAYGSFRTKIVLLKERSVKTFARNRTAKKQFPHLVRKFKAFRRFRVKRKMQQCQKMMKVFSTIHQIKTGDLIRKKKVKNVVEISVCNSGENANAKGLHANIVLRRGTFKFKNHTLILCVDLIFCCKFYFFY